MVRPRWKLGRMAEGNPIGTRILTISEHTSPEPCYVWTMAGCECGELVIEIECVKSPSAWWCRGVARKFRLGRRLQLDDRFFGIGLRQIVP